MTTAPIAAETVARDYIALWNETDAPRRAELLRAGWREDALYLDPLMQGRGHGAISALVGAVHQRYPGFRFALLGRPDAHGQQLRFSWTLGPADAPELIQGTDFVELVDGQLARVTGFLDKVPVGA